MRIGLAGIPYIGREKFFIDFKDTWNDYTLIDKGFGNVYIDKLMDETVLQQEIDDLYESIKKYTSINDKILLSTSPIDLISKLLFGIENRYVSNDFLNKNLKTINKMFDCLDVIFYIPISKFNKFTTPDKLPINEFYDELFLNAMNENFTDLYVTYATRLKNPFFDVENCPAIIEVCGDEKEKIESLKLLIDKEGNLIQSQSVLPKAETELIDNLNEQLTNDLIEIEKDKKTKKDKKQK